MKIIVCGKQHLKGTSKASGNPYDFYKVHFLGTSPQVEGEEGQSVNIDPQMISYEDIFLGSEYNVEFGPRGRVVAFTLV